MSALESFKKIQENVNKINNKVTIIVVSKTFSLDKVQPLINSGHIHYGENKVQEAKEKWSQYLDTNSNIKLHMIGRLQTNKAYDAVKLFDYIHSLDSEKLAIKLSLYEKDMSKKLKYFIQVNVDDEVHKSGIAPDKLKDFLTDSRNCADISKSTTVPFKFNLIVLTTSIVPHFLGIIGTGPDVSSSDGFSFLLLAGFFITLGLIVFF